jgi:hypothetical protein
LTSPTPFEKLRKKAMNRIPYSPAIGVAGAVFLARILREKAAVRVERDFQHEQPMPRSEERG